MRTSVLAGAFLSVPLLSLSCAGESGVLVYNAPPTAAILAPVDGTEVDETVPLTFEGRVGDDGDLLGLAIQWISDKDGILSDSSVPDPDGRIDFTTANLSPGNHAITLRVTDADGEQGAATIGVSIVDLPDVPEIELLRPTQGETYLEGDPPFSFGADVFDAQDAPETLEVVFLSSQDGFLCAAVADPAGEARCVATPLPSADPHLITAEVTDSEGFTNKATAYLTVRAIEDQDRDEDGWTPAQGDCNDRDEGVFPGAPEQPNGVDDDCDDIIDEGTVNYDDDGDGYAEVDGDCDDTNRLTWPDAPEVEDGEDNDCDSIVDEGTRVYDDDGDGYTEVGGDCDDGEPAVNPGATESCNGRDDNCNTLTDEENASGCSIWYADDDKDSYGDPRDSKCLCAAKAPHSATNNRDCYDNNALAYPGQVSWFGSHRGDGIYDYDCNGTQQQRYTDTFDCSGAVWICASHRDGWTSGRPTCGVISTWATECSGTFTGCNPSGRSSLQQQCR